MNTDRVEIYKSLGIDVKNGDKPPRGIAVYIRREIPRLRQERLVRAQMALDKERAEANRKIVEGEKLAAEVLVAQKAREELLQRQADLKKVIVASQRYKDASSYNESEYSEYFDAQVDAQVELSLLDWKLGSDLPQEDRDVYINDLYRFFYSSSRVSRHLGGSVRTSEGSRSPRLTLIMRSVLTPAEFVKYSDRQSHLGANIYI